MSARARRGRDIASFVGIACAACVALVAAYVAATAEPPADDRAATAEERRSIDRSFAVREPAIRLATERHFPGDRWSADDDFANVEQRAMRESARLLGVRTSDAVRAIDEGLHADGTGRRSNASPCKPRPFYD